MNANLTESNQQLMHCARQYDETKERRIGKIASIQRATNECNKLIAIENGLLAKLKGLRRSTTAVKLQLATLRASSCGCADTISLYGAFKKQNELYINTINSHSSAQWNAFESNCFEWSAHDLVVWLRKINALSAKDDNALRLVSQDIEEES